MTSLLFGLVEPYAKEGICVNVSVTTPEFGALMFETTITRLFEMVREFWTLPIRERVDHH